MLFEFIAAVVSAVAVAGIAMTLRFITRYRLPKWIVPASAGLGMLSYTIWSEYSWFDRVTQAMPPEVTVAWSNGAEDFWRPWSYYKPVINRFTAVDMRTAQTHPNHPGQVMVDLVLAARWQQSARLKVVFDCPGARRADLLGSDVSVADDGTITGADWINVGPDDPTLRAACAGQAGTST
ncbi:hypothetical protein FE840_003825 [Peteryoungia desertarenae]|uniref:Uncharacterized protein n=1 Tax=Peteryoungia desertarenae TaxID=1813451 RepID=A0ABX6QKA0_9HYPH|nr:hypothetical protein [Peteryoungia desertarenae]QLF68746.1 hypothetical protein FE840_003825 [Peteryoungia desertarenae]